jgi:hypothetical protein
MMCLGSRVATPAFKNGKIPLAQIKDFVAAAAILVKSVGRQNREAGNSAVAFPWVLNSIHLQIMTVSFSSVGYGRTRWRKNRNLRRKIEEACGHAGQEPGQSAETPGSL